MAFQQRVISGWSERGVTLAVAILVTTVLLSLGLSIALLLTNQSRTVTKQIYLLKALYMAEAAIERTLAEHLQDDPDKDWSNNEKRHLYLNEPLGEGSYTVTLKQAGKDSIIIEATAYCQTVERQIEATAKINWQDTPPHVTLSRWQDKTLGELWK